MTAIGERLRSIPNVFLPLRQHAEKYVRFGATIDESGAICIGPNPKVAPDYFVFRFYSPVSSESLAKRRSYDIPIDYLRFLAVTNGCFAYGMSLYGFTPQPESSPALFSRTSLQCHDLSIANELWIREYKLAAPIFHFGSRHYSYAENVGYFMNEDGAIRAILKSGREVGCWNDSTAFLYDELAAAEINNQSQNPK